MIEAQKPFDPDQVKLLDLAAIAKISRIVRWKRPDGLQSWHHRKILHAILERDISHALLFGFAINPTIGELEHFTQTPHPRYSPSSFAIELLDMSVRHALGTTLKNKYEGWATQQAPASKRQDFITIGNDLTAMINHNEPGKIHAVLRALPSWRIQWQRSMRAFALRQVKV